MRQWSRITDRDAALRFLFGRIDYERASAIPYQATHLKLERMELLLDRLGNPHRRMEVVHVAGSKGKGSTSTMIASILSSARFRTGLYTSPHLARVEERIAVGGVQCTAAELVELVDRVAREVETIDRQVNHAWPGENGPTYFEITTALALLHFRQKNVDVAVLEVGLGGRLDSTNVCQPRVCVITSISFDHTQQLGKTLAKIAAEKAGIIKSGIPVVSGVRDGPARAIIEQTAHGQSCPLVTLGVDFDFRYRPVAAPIRPAEDAPAAALRLPTPTEEDRAPSNTAGSELPESSPHGRMDYFQNGPGPCAQLLDLRIGLRGRHQAANAAVGVGAIDQLLRQSWDIPQAAIRQGLAAAYCPARVEIVSRRPLVIVDGAHNVASIQALLETLDELYEGRHRLLVFASTRGKDARGMLRELLGRFDQVFFTRYLVNPRSDDPHRLLGLAHNILAAGQVRCAPHSIQACDQPTAAWQSARRLASPEDLICVTGSFFLAAEVRPLIFEYGRLKTMAKSRPAAA